MFHANKNEDQNFIAHKSINFQVARRESKEQ